MQSQPYILHCCWIVLLLIVGAGCTSSPVAVQTVPSLVGVVEIPPVFVSSEVKRATAAAVTPTLKTNTLVFKYATNLNICNYNWVIEYKTNLNGSTWLTVTNLFWDPTTNCPVMPYLMASNIQSSAFFIRSKGTLK